MKCLRCQNDTFDKSIIFARIVDKSIVLAKTADFESRVYKFQVLSCTNCKLTQWYDYSVVTGEKGASAQETTENSFNCHNCKSKDSKTIQIRSNIGPFPCEEAFTWTGEFLSKNCRQCGLAEIYSTLICDPSRHHGVLKERIDLATSFRCPICNSKKVHKTGEIAFNRKLQDTTAYGPKETAEYYLFVVCDECKYTMFFKN